MPSIDVIVGLPHRSATKLRRVRVRTTEGLLLRAGTPEGRAELAEATGIAEEQLLAWCRLAELITVRGIGGEYAHLLTSVGVGTLGELAGSDPAELVGRLASRNGSARVVQRLPTPGMVAGWVASAADRESVIG